MKLWITSLVVAVALGLGSNALAQCCAGKAKAQTTAGQTASAAPETTAKTAGCGMQAGATAMAPAEKQACEALCAAGKLNAAGVPKMEYQVGDKTVACPMQAEQLAKEKNAAIVYVVAGKEYAARPQAMQAFGQALEAHLGTMTAVRYAVGEQVVGSATEAAKLGRESGGTVKYQVAGFSFGTQAEAEQATKLAREAADGVTLKVLADGKEVPGATAASLSAAADSCCAAGSGGGGCGSMGAGATEAGKGTAKAGASAGCCGAGGEKAAPKAPAAKTEAAKPEATPANTTGAKAQAKAEVSAKPGTAAKITATDKQTGAAAQQSTASAQQQPACHAAAGAAAAGAVASPKHEYVIGDQKTCCPLTARVQLATAKIRAAQKAVEAFAAGQPGQKLAQGA